MLSEFIDRNEVDYIIKEKQAQNYMDYYFSMHFKY